MSEVMSKWTFSMIGLKEEIKNANYKDTQEIDTGKRKELSFLRL